MNARKIVTPHGKTVTPHYVTVPGEIPDSSIFPAQYAAYRIKECIQKELPKHIDNI